jgi:hypothetical protein
MTRPGAPRWFERVPSWALSAAALPFAVLGWLVDTFEPEDLGGDD